MTNEHKNAAAAGVLNSNAKSPVSSALYSVPTLKAPPQQPQQCGIELDTSLTSLGWLQNMSIGAGPSGFGGPKMPGVQAERRKPYRAVPTPARPPHPKSAPTQKSSSSSKQNQRPKSAPMLGGKSQPPIAYPSGSPHGTWTAMDDNNNSKPTVASEATGTASLPLSPADNASQDDVRVPASKREEHPRPPYTYAVLVHMALNDFDDHCGTLEDVCQWLIKQYPFFEKKAGNTNWAEVIKSNLKAVGHAAFDSETNKWSLLSQHSEIYKSPANMRKRGPKPPRKQNKLRSPSLDSLHTIGEAELRFSAAGTLQLSKSQSFKNLSPSKKQPKSKVKKRSNSVTYHSVSSLVPKSDAEFTLADTNAVLADLFSRRDGSSESFDWESMIKLNQIPPPINDILTPTASVLSEMIKNEHNGSYEDFPSVVSDIEMDSGMGDSESGIESGIAGLLNTVGGEGMNLTMHDTPYDNLMDSNLLTSDWTVAF